MNGTTVDVVAANPSRSVGDCDCKEPAERDCRQTGLISDGPVQDCRWRRGARKAAREWPQEAKRTMPLNLRATLSHHHERPGPYSGLGP